MGYYIGQFRKDQLAEKEYGDDFLTHGSVISKPFNNQYGTINFTEPCFGMDIIKQENTHTHLIMNTNYCYYLQFSAYVTGKSLSLNDHTFSVQLININTNNNKLNGDVQNVRNFKISKTMSSQTQSINFELIFQPNSVYEQIMFLLSRTQDDLINPRTLHITINHLVQLENIIPKIQGYIPPIGTIKRIGLQGPPGMLFCINGEEIRIGRSGIYELQNNLIKITNLGFVLKDALLTQGSQTVNVDNENLEYSFTDINKKDYFILDFQYSE